MWHRRFVAAPALFAALAACGVGHNYGPNGPHYTGTPTPLYKEAPVPADTLTIVSFNLAYGQHTISAIELFGSEPHLRAADIVLLQEMDAPRTRQVAEALGMFYSYYPANLSTFTRRDFGTAVLSRWPIVGHARITLPHRARFGGIERATTAATILIGGDTVRVYSVHLGTIADVGPAGRREQLRTVLEDATRYSRVIIGGDMNNRGVGRVAREYGYAWLTENGPPSFMLWRWDHIFVRGLGFPTGASSGTVRDADGVSDHKPVWARVILPKGVLT